jgi:cell division protein FtsL
LQKLIAEQDIQRRRTSGSLMTGLVVIVAILSVLRVILANWQVESSETLRDLDNKISEQTTANQTLAEQLREKESLTVIENQAKALGYNQDVKLTFLTSEPNVAMNSQVDSLVR